MKITSHQLVLSDLQSWVNEHETVYASNGKDKMLKVSAGGVFKVYHNGLVYWQTMQPYTAVEKYNELP